MKKIKVLLPIIFVFAIFLPSCDGSLENSFAFRNFALGDVTVNFRANLYTVPAGETFTLKELPKGVYEFTTIYERPAGATSATATGDVSGTVEFRQSTRILLVYTSTFDDSAYTLHGTLTTSDDLSEEDPTGP